MESSDTGGMPNRPLRKETLQNLAVRAMANDAVAYEALSERLLGAFARMARERWGLDQAAAEHIASQTVSESLQSLANGRYDPGRAEFVTFAYAVGRRVVLRHIAERGRWFQQLSDSALAIRSDLGHDESSGAERVEALLDCLRAESAGASLSEEERYVAIGLAYQKTLAELAKELGRSLDTVHRRKMQGLRKLRECMAAKGFTNA
jgi:RNA polymerase sigma factor (sigma-70 family)